GNAGGTVTLDGGTLQATATFSSNRSMTVTSNNGNIDVTGTNALTWGGVISGSGALTKTDTGTLELTSNDSYAGTTTIAAGTLQLGNGGASGSIVGNVTDNGTLAFDRSDIFTYGGVISGTGAVQQIGPGTLVLTGNNSYAGTTTITAGTLQLGNGGASGSIVGNVTDNGTLAFDRSDAVTFARVISGTGSVQQKGSGTTILSGINTYTGGTIVNAGTLTVNSAQALGLGDVVVNGGTLNADPRPINVHGNYTQNAGGTLELQVAGANFGQYDFLNVGGNAAVGGTLQLISLGFQPTAGDQLTLVTSGGAVTGRFARFGDPFTIGPGLNTINLVYGRNSVVLQFLNLTTPISPAIPTLPTFPSPPLPPTFPPALLPEVIATVNFASFALTPNQLAAASLLNEIQLNPKTANLFEFLYQQPLPAELEKISPDGLTAFYEISFLNANIQRLNLEGRLDDLRSGSTGFSSNMKVNGATVNPDGKSSKKPVEQAMQPRAENRWGVWVTGFGDFVNVDADGNANGYDFTTGGFSLGVDYRISDQLAIGAMGQYAHTWTSLQPSGDIDVDSGRGGVYATWFNHGIYLNAAIYGGHNTYESSRSSLGGLATGGTAGAEWSTFISGGYDSHFGQLTVGPIAALQYTYLNIDSFTEKGSLAPLAIHSRSAESLRTDVGFRAYYIWQLGKVMLEPNLRAAWEHEYKYSALPITGGFAGIPGPSATFFGPNEGHDSAIVSAGVSVHWTPAVETYVNYDGQLGR
ncbi:MAG: autotransporter domain-containing protein, partial [Verrucomicrobia bacterium]|nr:autotransporter domain-containing protein [Verrucomicrobiota bacterium]